MFLFTMMSLCLLGAGTPLPAWDFNAPDDLLGWKLIESVKTHDIADGALNVRITDGTMFAVHEGVSFEATPYQCLVIRLKASRAGEGCVIWANDGPYDWSNRVTFQVPTAGEWLEIPVIPFWQAIGTVKKLRVDLYEGADFNVDWIKVVPWTTADTPQATEPAWTLEDGYSAWEPYPGAPVLFAPPCRLALSAKRFVTIRTQSDIACKSAVLFAPQSLPGYCHQSFTIPAGESVTNVALEMRQGRECIPTWSDPVVGIGLDLPANLRGQVRVQSIRISDKPEGPIHPSVRYLGFEEAINRAGKACSVMAEIENVGGEPGEVTASLSLPEGASVAGAPGHTFHLDPLGAAPVQLRWEVTASQPGPVELKLDISGAPTPRIATLTFDAPLTLAPSAYVPTPRPVPPVSDVMMFYFPGWPEWRVWDCLRRYAPERRPWLGYYTEGTPETVDWQIKSAVENSITGFVVDWYWDDGETKLNHWLEGYDKAKYRDQLKVCIMWCNHVGTVDVPELRTMIRHCNETYFKWPGYYRIDGKLLFGIWDAGRLRAQLGGSEGVRQALEACKEEARAAGFEGLAIFESGNFMAKSPEHMARLAREGYNGFTNYHEWIDAMSLALDTRAIPYASVMATAPLAWERHRSDCDPSGLFYPPLLESGWSPGPWHGGRNNFLSLADRTANDFESGLRAARAYAEANKPPFVLLGPANEWGEGSYLEPCVEYGFSMYEAVRSVFGTGDPKDWPVNITPSDVGLGPYDIPPPPLRSSWTFSTDTQGWHTLMGCAGFGCKDGALAIKTTTADPAIGADVQVDMSKAQKLRVRMQVTGQQVADDFAQFFWALPNGETSGAASVLFPLVRDGSMHEYTVELGSIAARPGMTQRLRFDPVSSAGVTVMIESISVEP